MSSFDRYDAFKCIFTKENIAISFEFNMEFVLKYPIENKSVLAMV